MSIFDFFRSRAGQPVAEDEAPPIDSEEMGDEDDYGDLGAYVPPSPTSGKVTTYQKMEQRFVNFVKTAPKVAHIDAKGNYMVGDDSTGNSSLKADLASGFGSMPQAIQGWYDSFGFVGYQRCAQMALNPMINKVVSIPAEDAVRNGWDVAFQDGQQVSPETMSQIRRFDEVMKVSDNIVECLRMANVYGVRVVLFEVDSKDPLYYEKPFNLDGVTAGSYKGISQIDPYWLAPELDQDAAGNPASKHFYEPTWWRCGDRRYHRSHLFVYIPRPVADVMKPAYLFGGLSMPEMIFAAVYNASRVADEIPRLAMSKRLMVLNIALESAAGKVASLAKRLANFVGFRDNSGVYVAGKDDQVQQLETSLADLDTVVMTAHQLVAAVGELPSTKLLGTSPKGFGGEGDYETTSYHETLESKQSHGGTPLLNRHYALLRKSYMPDLPNLIVKWRPVGSMTASELADVNQKNSMAALNYCNAGAVDGQDVRQTIINDVHSPYQGLDAAVPEDAGNVGAAGNDNPQM